VSTRATLQAKVEVILGDRDDKTAVINQGLDLALFEFSQMYPFKELLSIADIGIVDTNLYVALPANFHHLIEVRLIDSTNSYPVEVKTKEWVVKKFPNIADGSSDRPRYVYVEGANLYMAPKNNGTYTLTMTYGIAVSSSYFTTDVTVNPVPDLDNALVFYAAAFTFEQMELPSTSDRWYAQANTAFQKAVRANRRNNVVHRVEAFPEAERIYTTERWRDPFDMGD